MEKQSDIDVAVAQVLGGDRDAYRTVIIKCEAKVRLLLATLLPDVDSVDDIAQEAFFTAYLKLSQYKLGTDFVAWLKAIARNIALNERTRWLRKHKMVRKYKVHIERTIEHDVTSFSDDLDDGLLGALHDCVDKLTEHHKEVVQDYYFAGVRVKDIAKKRDRPAKWVSLVLHRARLALGRCLQKKGRLDKGIFENG